jgi:phage gpG-like protein
MAVSVTVNDEAAQALLQRLQALISNPSAPLRASAQTLRRLVIDTFQDQSDPWGRRWKAWAPSTRKERARNTSGAGILLRTFAMFRSVEAQSTADGVTVTVGTEYASYHQFGNPAHRAWGGKVSPLPQRAFLPLRAPGVADIPASWWQEILLPVENAIAGAAR